MAASGYSCPRKVNIKYLKPLIRFQNFGCPYTTLAKTNLIGKKTLATGGVTGFFMYLYNKSYPLKPMYRIENNPAAIVTR